MNILLVDDDRFIIEALREKINWAKLHIDIVYVAYSLTQAQNIIREHPIDLMISDIEMPQGSGLELLSWIRNEKYDIKTIFLTNYADFNYAQKAIELQSFEYYLKPINFEKLEFIIQKAISKIENHNLNGKNDALLQIEDNFWYDYLRKPQISRIDELENIASKQDFILQKHQYFFLAVFTINLNEEDYSAETPSWTSQLKRELQRISQPSYKLISLFKMESQVDQYVCLFRVDSSKRSDKLAYEIHSQISNNFSKYSNIIYKSCHKISDILFHTKELYTYNEQYVSYWNTITCVPHSFPTSFKTETLSITFLDSLSEYELREKINSLAYNSQIPTFTLQQILLDWTQQIGIYLDQKGISAHKLFQNSTHDFLFQRRFHSIESFQDYFDYYWSHAKKFATNIENQKNSIQRIVEYIDHHYYEDINRSILADMVYLSADHLARIFKKETGETLVKYITDKRINAAKSLLSQTNISISQVSCQVGYDNYSYFTKIFKQRTGLSPGDYRKTYQNKM